MISEINYRTSTSGVSVFVAGANAFAHDLPQSYSDLKATTGLTLVAR